MVGVNRFTEDGEISPPLLKVNPVLEEQQKRKLAALRMRRDSAGVSGTLRELKEAALSDQNVMPFLIDAVESYATLGEIADNLRSVWGEFRDQS